MTDYHILRKLEDTFHRSDSEDIAGELDLLQGQCQEIINKEIVRVASAECSEKILVHRCEFSKLQFPKSQCKRSQSKIPVRYCYSVSHLLYASYVDDMEMILNLNKYCYSIISFCVYFIDCHNSVLNVMVKPLRGV